MTTTAPANSNARSITPSRMSLANVTRGKLEVPVKCLGYGPDGAGKSTWASGAPRPIWLPLDNRTAHLDIERLPQPATWDEALEGLRLLELEKHDFKTVVVDPVNWLEPLVALKVTGDPSTTLTEYKGGYGKGEAAAFQHWRVLVSQLERLWTRGMNVILLAHCSVKTFRDPEGPEYDRYEIALAKNAAGLLRQWCDYVLFMKQEAVGKIDSKTQRARGQETGERRIYTSWRAAYDAKFSGSAPPELTLSWRAFHEAVTAGRQRVEEMRARIEAMCAELVDQAVVAKVRAYVVDAKDDANRLDEIANAVLGKLNEQKAGETPAKGNDQ